MTEAQGTGEGQNEAPAPSPAAQQVKRFRGAVSAIRKRANLSAKVTTGLGTTALTGIAIGKFADVFPLQDTSASKWAAAVAVIGFFLLAVAIAVFASRLWKVDSPVWPPVSTDEIRTSKLPADVKTATIARYDRVAARNGAPSLTAYQARGWRLERIALETTDADERTRLLDEAKAIDEEVQAATAEAAADIVRANARDVLTGRWTIVMTLLFIVGLIGVAVGADYLDGERSGKLTVAKDCAAAGKALAEQTVADRDLPSICSDLKDGGTVPADERKVAFANACATAVKALTDAKLDTSKLTAKDGPCPAASEDDAAASETPEDVAAGALPELLTRAANCETTAVQNNQSADGCAPLYEQIEAMRKQASG